jgi:hypothetical protein
VRIRNRPASIIPPLEIRGGTPNTVMTCDNPPLDTSIPKSSTRLVIEGLRIIAYPSMRLVKRCKNLEELDESFTRLSIQLQLYRNDLVRPFGTCPRCALPFESSDKAVHQCP